MLTLLPVYYYFSAVAFVQQVTKLARTIIGVAYEEAEDEAEVFTI